LKFENEHKTELAKKESLISQWTHEKDNLQTIYERLKLKGSNIISIKSSIVDVDAEITRLKTDFARVSRMKLSLGKEIRDLVS